MTSYAIRSMAWSSHLCSSDLAKFPEGLGPYRAADIMDRDIDAPMPLDHIPVKRTGAVSFLKVVNFTISVEPVGTKARNGRHRGVLGAVSDGHCRAFPGHSGRNRQSDALGSARTHGNFLGISP